MRSKSIATGEEKPDRITLFRPGGCMALKPSDETKFLTEVEFALAFDLDAEDSTPEELEAHLGAQADAEARVISPRLLAAALQYVKDVEPAWLLENRSMYDRWCRVFAAGGMLEKHHPRSRYFGKRPSMITIDGITYLRP